MAKRVGRLLIIVRRALPIARIAMASGSMVVGVAVLLVVISVLIQRMASATDVLIAVGAGRLALAQATLRQRASALEAAQVRPQAAKHRQRVIGTATSHFASPEDFLILTPTAHSKCLMAESSHTPLPLM